MGAENVPSARFRCGTDAAPSDTTLWGPFP